MPDSLDLGAPYHIGIVVHDLDEAMRVYGEKFGISAWRRGAGPPRPSGQQFRQLTSRGRPIAGISAKLAFSVTGPPYLELVEPTGDVDWSASAHLREVGEGIYHLGYWVDDLEAAIAAAEAGGTSVEFVMLRESEDGALSGGIAYLSPDSANGVRVELVSSQEREGFLRWVKTGE